MASKTFEKGRSRYTCKDLCARRYNGVLGRVWERRLQVGDCWLYMGQRFFSNSATRKQIQAWGDA